MFPAEVYIERRKRLQKEVGTGIILFPGNRESPANYADNPLPFRQDSNFLYYFGLNRPDLTAVIDIDADEAIIFGDDLTLDDIVWTGPQLTIREQSAAAGVTRTAPAADLASTVAKALSHRRPVHFTPPYRPEHLLQLSALLNMPPGEVSAAASEKLIVAIVEMRNIKSAAEIDEIEKAVNISADMHLAAYKMVRPGLTEAQIAAEVHRVALAAGGQLSFPIIATIHGETLHNHYHGNTLKSGDLFLLDAGAETSMGYAGDLSSTMPVDPVFTSRQKEIYQVAFNAHEAAIAALKPGVPFREIHLLACRTIAAGMKELGLMKGDLDEAVDLGAHALFFQCGLGHMMGLDVHDMENLGEKYVGYAGQEKSTLFGIKSLRLARELKPGYVLTIEPGIYFIPVLIERWKAEHKFADFINYDKVEAWKDFGGLRNEEDFVITDTGARLLGKPIPKSIEEVEAIRG